MRRATIPAALLLAFPAAVYSQESADEAVEFLGFKWRAAPLTEPLVADRPDFTEATSTVPFGHLQIESGYTYTHDDDNDFRDHTFPELLLRLGVVENFELRFGWAGYTESETNNVDADGFNDVSFGFKVTLLEQEGAVPHFGVLASLSAPAGEDSVSSDGYDPFVGLLWAYDLSETLSIAGNVNFAWPTENGGHFFQGSSSLSLATAFDETWGGYVEYFAFYPTGDTDGGPSHFINTGVTHLVNPNLQFDARIGFGLNDRADDLFTGIGVVMRF